MSRRGIVLAAGGAVAVGGVTALWPLAASFAPNQSSLPDTERVNLDSIGEGAWRTVKWRGLPIVVRHRTGQEIALARAVVLGDLRDSLARVAGQPESLPALDENRVKPGRAQWLVVDGRCPRSGCLIDMRRLADAIEPGSIWFCPCDACHFDTSGRVMKGRSTENLAVPPYRFISPTEIEIGIA